MTKLGKLLFTLVFLALVIFGVSKWWNRLAPANLPKGLRTETKQAGSDVELATTQTEIPRAESRRRLHAEGQRHRDRAERIRRLRGLIVAKRRPRA
jgi:hypothetical protein